MKNLITILAVGAILALSTTSCSKCYVCTDKTNDTFSKTEYCDKDFDKGDIDARIESAENNGYSCHAKSRAF